MEVIAKKSKASRMNWMILILSILGIIIGVCYLFVFQVKVDILKWIFGIGGFIVGGSGFFLLVVTFVRERKIPENIIMREEDTLHILGCDYKISEVTSVKESPDAQGNGYLTITVGAKKITCIRVAEVLKAASRLRELMEEYQNISGENNG